MEAGPDAEVVVPRSFRRNDSSGKLQIPSSKLQRSSKPKTSTRRPGCLNGDHIVRALIWSLRFGASLELEDWSSVLIVPYSIENSEELKLFD